MRPSPARNLVPGAEPAVDVARILDEAQIPHFLWGRVALGLVGLYFPQRRGSEIFELTVKEEIDFVVEDEHIKLTTKQLTRANFTRCKDECMGLRCDRQRPVPEVHFHLGSKYRQCSFLSLLPKSTTLWWLPNFPLDAPAADDLNLTVISHSRLPPRALFGCISPWADLYPIKILNPNSFTEGMILLGCRDDGQRNGLFVCREKILLALSEEQDIPGITVKKNPRPRFQHFWKEGNRYGPQGVNIGELMARLRLELMRANEFPTPPEYNAFEEFELDEWERDKKRALEEKKRIVGVALKYQMKQDELLRSKRRSSSNKKSRTAKMSRG
ncbi:hypothetical protein NUU61_005704 [Penicillium alfredii]|uniref:Uncharacterized protein n=1 Tax=Penicillium alfredii TaxID=1506179 RepID=A0A9W9F9Y8_9EURO|nr:uncharacterized protein NUU61_005704 [Penicillium alfredii]KAJ5096348.1 hypothetical protein NUU61_005704 [Penicillium alfredii]